jgi:hypothetical protein
MKKKKRRMVEKHLHELREITKKMTGRFSQPDALHLEKTASRGIAGTGPSYCPVIIGGYGALHNLCEQSRNGGKAGVSILSHSRAAGSGDAFAHER